MTIPAAADAPPARRWPAVLTLVAVIAASAPLFIGLSNRDFENDEAIYSYAVDRVLETGEWLATRAMPHDSRFLEKPPLKIWMVAAGVRSGLLPRDEFGYRFLDALFGTLAFIYVFHLARRLAGPLAGAGALVVLLTLERLLFEHGLRANNMEAPLVLSYCGGIYHFLRWMDGTGRSRTHALACAGFFVLGVMTKFVAVVFLPAIWVVSFVLMGGARTLRPQDRRDVAVAAVVACAAIAPWFIYESLNTGREFWNYILGEHVVQRFTTGLLQEHLHPWNYYLSELWGEFSRARTHWIAAAGLGLLAVRARHDGLSRILLVWAVLPVALLSLSSSKLFHYMYPFLPPLAIGAGAAVAGVVRWLDPRKNRSPASPAASRRRRFDDLLLAGALATAVVAAWTALAGSFRWTVEDVTLFRNSSVWRPLGLAALLLIAGARHSVHYRRLSPILQFVVVCALLPLNTYGVFLGRADGVDKPLQTLRSCVMALPARPDQTRVYLQYDDLRSHSYYYYLRTVAPWAGDLKIATDEVLHRLPPHEKSIVMLPRGDYRRLVRNFSERGMTTVKGDPPDVTSLALPIVGDVALLLPNEFQECAEPVRAAGRDVSTRLLAAK